MKRVECPHADLRFAEQTPMLPMLRTGSNDPVVSLPEDAAARNFVFVYDNRETTRMEAVLNVTRTLVICVVLVFGSLCINRITNDLVLKPIERMIDKVKAISTNPLMATRIGDSEHMKEEDAKEKAEEYIRSARGLRKKWLQWKQRRHNRKEEPMETLVLEKTIIKIGGLLALGFGEAGADVIGQNLKGTSGEVKVLIPGRRMKAVFGLAKIKNFATVTDVLQQHVLTFVNYVAEIVHGFVDEFFGAPNKNLGDSFVLVWRVPDERTASSSVGPQIPVIPDQPGREDRVVADFAAVSATKVVAAVRKSPILAEYSNHPGLLQRLYEFTVEISIGMHFGWAIEGAIGSEFKVDVSYLSTHVNLATRLESLAKDLNVELVLSEALRGTVSESIQRMLRPIDCALLAGFKNAQLLFTLDLDPRELKPITKTQEKNEKDKKLKKFKVRQIREQRKFQKAMTTYVVAEVMQTDIDIIQMRQKYTDDFFRKFDMGYRNYVSGEWGVAREMLVQTLQFFDDTRTGRRRSC
jgi:class 3 adenylate cyclase